MLRGDIDAIGTKDDSAARHLFHNETKKKQQHRTMQDFSAGF
ncbi:Uncharacterized protein ToN1_32670 [Aromatoleum petrolei]|nr:Uncharacterized protein ToN1_32670 [Aromatoleum petrolei]